jgi:glucose-6-phosphate 1-dehydrogenase
MADDSALRPVAKPGAKDDAPRHTFKAADPCAMVLFGATGDLAKRLVVPALYNLSVSGVLPDHFALIGVARGEDLDSWRKMLRDTLTELVEAKSGTFNADHIDEKAWKRLADRMSFVPGDVTTPELYKDVSTALDAAGRKHGTKGNALFYLAITHLLFGTVVDNLGKAGLIDQPPEGSSEPRLWRRVVIEKPFGFDLASARALNADILKTLSEDQIFRIDHFLGKDTVQSIMAFRFANGLFEPIWNRDRIDHVQISAAETVGVEKRGDFYEHTGALRDMAPNHLMSLLSLVAMEPPTSFDAVSVREKKADVLASIPPVDPTDAVRGQYGPGAVGGTKKVGYRDEPDVAKTSNVETYAALKLEIDNWRWSGVPFYLRTGKHLSARMTEIAIRFKPAPYAVFRDTPVDELPPNWLVIRIAPDEGISLQFEVKRRGPVLDLAPVKMEFRYDDWFPKEANVGYETLLYDVMIGDPTLFMRADMVEHGWRIIEKVQAAWAKGKPDAYASGSKGPKSADALIGEDGGRTWRPVQPPPSERKS